MYKYSMAEHFQNLDSQCYEVLRYIFNSFINWQTFLKCVLAMKYIIAKTFK